jgi:beta-phosphoglucomutase-like phosphatase (HAD superfamily)
VDGWLARLELTRHFQTTVCRGDAPAIKPAPDLFLAAAARLGVAPSACLVIEDSLNGVIAANAAGMTAWAVPNRVTAELDFASAARVFGGLTEVAEAWFALRPATPRPCSGAWPAGSMPL